MNPARYRATRSGAIAQLGERDAGSVEVEGSNPSGSTNPRLPAPTLVMRISYLFCSALALIAALFSTAVLIILPIPRELVLSLTLSTLCNYAFAFGGYGRATVLKAQSLGLTLPVWNRVSFHVLALSVTLMFSSMLAFQG